MTTITNGPTNMLNKVKELTAEARTKVFPINMQVVPTPLITHSMRSYVSSKMDECRLDDEMEIPVNDALYDALRSNSNLSDEQEPAALSPDAPTESAESAPL
jgi:predicted FMN-binding regulatory protein PaiB